MRRVKSSFTNYGSNCILAIPRYTFSTCFPSCYPPSTQFRVALTSTSWSPCIPHALEFEASKKCKCVYVWALLTAGCHGIMSEGMSRKRAVRWWYRICRAGCLDQTGGWTLQTGGVTDGAQFECLSGHYDESPITSVTSALHILKSKSLKKKKKGTKFG